jgi:hypothetical protein
LSLLGVGFGLNAGVVALASVTIISFVAWVQSLRFMSIIAHSCVIGRSPLVLALYRLS